MKTLKTIILCVVLTGCNLPEPPMEREFVCETGGALSERHVGVAKARYARTGDWVITYVEGNRAVYRQQPGEACALEEYNTP